MKPTHTINLAGNPDSCIVRIGGQRWRALIDSGAQVSLVDSTLFEELRKKNLVTKINRKAHLQTANGQPLKVKGCVVMEFKVGQEQLKHQFFVVQGLSRKIILGKDWLTDNGVRLYWDLGTLRVGRSYVTMEEDLHIARVVRITTDTVITPQSVTICPARTKGFTVGPDMLYEVRAVTQGFLGNEPGLLISNTVIKSRDVGKFPIMIVNSTNKTYKVRKGCVIAQIHQVPIEGVVNIRGMPHTTDNKPLDLSELQVADKYREVIEELIRNNRHLFATTDLELGHTDTTEMKIDTGKTAPIKMRPYRTPLTKRPIVDKAIDDMLEAGVVRRSSSAWAFPIVVVDKKDGTKRFCVDFRWLVG